MVPKASILIVEDSFIVAYHLKTTLESEGYHVIGTVDSGEEALELLKKNKPDLVLMDIMLNGVLDGVETARLVKQDHNLPVIYITALTDRDTIQRAKITEPYGYLTKPFEDREIFTVIEMALYKHNIESRLKQSEEKYFSTVRSISDAVVIIDQNFRITYMNPGAEEILGRSFSHLQQCALFDVMQLKYDLADDLVVNPLQCELNQLRINSMPKNLILVSHDGKQKFVGDGSLSPVIDNKGICTGMVLIFKDLTQKIEHEKLLQRFEAEKLSALFEGQEKERSRIARDLHDGLGQMLTAIKMNIDFTMVKDEKGDHLRKLIDDAIQESVRISENLQPSKLKDFDLATCINSLCKQINLATQVKVTFENLGDVPEVDPNQKIHFFRIAQEALNNAIKHAKPSCINVQLSQTDDRTFLTIEDDGGGIPFSADGHSSRHGLANMRDRAELMGGKLTIESDKNRGTLVIVEAPFKRNTIIAAV
jgi:PAS domain S-box-containing protein